MLMLGAVLFGSFYLSALVGRAVGKTIRFIVTLPFRVVRSLFRGIVPTTR